MDSIAANDSVLVVRHYREEPTTRAFLDGQPLPIIDGSFAFWPDEFGDDGVKIATLALRCQVVVYQVGESPEE